MTRNEEPRTIALVEDNPDNMLLLRVLLKDQYHLHEYTDGIAALDGILETPPDLVLMDISLPGLDGIAVLDRIRRAGLDRLPVIALTAHAMVGDRERFLASGFDFYIAKPILEKNQLVEPIRNLLDSARS